MPDTAWREQVNQKIITEFRANRGAVSPAVFGDAGAGLEKGPPLLLLHHTGRKTGRSYVTPLTYTALGDGYVVRASNSGLDGDPQWYHNVAAAPEVTVELGAETFTATVREARGDERDRLHAILLDDPAMGAHHADVDRKKAGPVPILVLERNPTAV
jgi:deazaflavin-dependent oxidoreductase (nitroreductase family)